MWVLKKVVSRVLFPVPLSLELLFGGLILLWFTRRQRAGRILATGGTLLLLGFSSCFTANALLRPLERQYAPARSADATTARTPVNFIVVLGGRAYDDPALSPTSRLSPHLLARLVEGIRLQRENPGSKLVVSGSHGSARGMAEVAETLGVPTADIIRLPQPSDTAEEAAQVATLIGRRQFVLVTSAAHMPRALTLFRQHGLAPLAAPADFMAPRHPIDSDDIFPDAYKLLETQGAIYEYLGLAWAWLSSW